MTISPIIDTRGQVVGASKVAHDISERKAALIKSEKLAVAGRLAATLTHEINNPLQAIANLGNIWAQSPGQDPQGKAYAAMAENELRRVTHSLDTTVSQLLQGISFSNTCKCRRYDRQRPEHL